MQAIVRTDCLSPFWSASFSNKCRQRFVQDPWTAISSIFPQASLGSSDGMRHASSSRCHVAWLINGTIRTTPVWLGMGPGLNVLSHEMHISIAIPSKWKLTLELMKICSPSESPCLKKQCVCPQQKRQARWTQKILLQNDNHATVQKTQFYSFL